MCLQSGSDSEYYGAVGRRNQILFNHEICTWLKWVLLIWLDAV